MQREFDAEDRRSSGLAVMPSLPIASPRMRFARRFDQRLIGLLGREGLSGDEALWIEPCGSVHTFGMRFAIDVVFLDRDDRIVRVVACLPPQRWCRAPGARVAIEFAAGAACRWSLVEGQRWAFDSGRARGQRGAW